MLKNKNTIQLFINDCKENKTRTFIFLIILSIIYATFFSIGYNHIIKKEKILDCINQELTQQCEERNLSLISSDPNIGTVNCLARSKSLTGFYTIETITISEEEVQHCFEIRNNTQSFVDEPSNFTKQAKLTGWSG